MPPQEIALPNCSLIEKLPCYQGKLPDIHESYTTYIKIKMQSKKERQNYMLMSEGELSTQRWILEMQYSHSRTRWTSSAHLNATPHKVVSKTRNQVVVESPIGARYRRNTTHMKRYETNRPKEIQSTLDSVLDADTHAQTNITQTPHQDTQISDMPMARLQRIVQ